MPVLSDEVRDQIIAAVRAGNFADVAAAAAGITSETFWAWRRRGEAEASGGPYRTFFDEVRKAEALAEVGAVVSLRRAFAVPSGQAAPEGDWRAGEAWLRMKFPRKYAYQLKIQLRDEINDLLDVCASVLTPGDFRKVLTAIAARSGEDEVGAVRTDRGGSGEGGAG